MLQRVRRGYCIKQKKEVAALLREGKNDLAKIRCVLPRRRCALAHSFGDAAFRRVCSVEYCIRDDNRVAAFELLELYVSLRRVRCKSRSGETALLRRYLDMLLARIGVLLNEK